MRMQDILQRAHDEGLASLYQNNLVVERVAQLGTGTLNSLKSFIPQLEQIPATEIGTDMDEARRRARSLSRISRVDVDTDALAVLFLLSDASRHAIQHTLVPVQPHETDSGEEHTTWRETPISNPEMAVVL